MERDNLIYFEASAKTGENVQSSFYKAITYLPMFECKNEIDREEMIKQISARITSNEKWRFDAKFELAKKERKLLLIKLRLL